MQDIVINWFIKNYKEYYDLMNNITHSKDNGDKSPYHMEGSIWEHTKMVLNWNKKEDINHIFACLLHDLGKVYTRVENNTKVSFFNHENISTYLSIDILKEAKKEFNDLDIIKVLKFIAWHGSLWLKKGDLQDTLKIIDYKYGHCFDFYKDFVSFVEADALGRILEFKEDEDKMLEQASFLSNYIPYDKTKHSIKQKNEVIFLIGLSGSGKSTYINNNPNLAKYKILSVDNILDKGKLNYNSIDYKKNVKKAYNQVILNMLDYIKKEENVIVDMTNLDKENRRRKLSKFPSSKYEKTAIVFLNGKKSIYKNLSNRPDKKISDDILDKQIFNFELPNYDEFDKIEFIL